MGFPPWQGASRCTSGPQPGTTALMKWIMDNYQVRGAMNWGIFNCRTVRGGSTTSCHGEGRAGDVGFAVGDPDGDELKSLLLKAPGRLGIQAIIYERTIFSAVSPGGRPYTGVAPHWDHIHFENTWEAARNLTYATVAEVMGNLRKVKTHKPGSRRVDQGDSGTDVAFVQRWVGAEADGVFGPKTAEAVLRWKRLASADFPKLDTEHAVIGKLAWAVMGITPTYGEKDPAPEPSARRK